MDEPTPGGVTTDPQPMRRYDWERIVLWADLPKHIKAVALAMATFANPDGSNVRPGNMRIADAFDDSETTAGKSIEILVKLGLLKLVSKGGPSHDPDKPGRASVYRLSSPGEALPKRLDPDWNRLIPRKKGKTPTNRPSGGKAESKPSSRRAPVENPADPSPASPQGSADNGSDPNPTSGPEGGRPEVRNAPTRSGTSSDLKPASDYQGDHPPTRTTRVVALGGERHLTLVHSRATDEELDHPVVVEPEPPEPGAPGVRCVPDVSDEQYAAAHDRLSTLPDYGTALLAQALAEFAANGWSDVPATVLAVRAAQIADRQTPRSA